MTPEQYEQLVNVISSLATPGWVEISSLIVGALGLIAVVIAYLGLRVTHTQMAQAWQWQKATLQNQKLFEGVSIEVELRIARILGDLELKPYEAVTKDKCVQIYQNPNKWIPIKFFLNHYEILCVAMSAGIVDKELAYNLHSSRVVFLWSQWGDLCRYVREQQQDCEIYWELEKWAGKFLNEQKKRENNEKNSRQQIEQQIAQGKGMKDVVESRSYKSDN